MPHTRRRLALLAALLLTAPTLATVAAQQREVRFPAAGGQMVFGTWYPAEGTARAIIIALHQGGASGDAEYGPIVPRLTAGGFDVLTVDLRSGGDRFGGLNRTVQLRGSSADYCDAGADIAGALRFVRMQAPDTPIILWGSSFSAALVIREAVTDSAGVVGVLAFSPASGDPMVGCQPEQAAERIAVPLLVLRPRSEMALDHVGQQAVRFRMAGHKVVVADPGTHGSSMLVAERVDGPVAGTWAEVEGFLREVAP